MKCSILLCNNPAKLCRALNESIEIGALGYQPVAIPLCKEHDDIAYSNEYLESLLLKKKEAN